MKNAKDMKMAILGLGYLMEYILPCYQAAFGEKMAEQMIAVTADEADLERKQKKFTFPVLLNDNRGALERLEPDYILLAPPPQFAPDLAEQVLKPYYGGLREKGRPLPTLFAFPPNPKGSFYVELLGADCRVVNILPNMVSEIAGERLVGEGLTYLTYPDAPNLSPWTAEEKKFVSDFFSPLGGTIEVAPAQVSQMLAGTVTVHNISEVIFTITDALNSVKKQQFSHQDIAGAMRAYHQKKHGYHAPGCSCTEEALPPYLAFMLHKVTYHWFMGIKRFYLNSGIAPEVTDAILVSLLDLHLHVHQRETRADIEQKTKQHATKGGVLDKGCQMFARFVECGLRKEFAVYPHMMLTDAWCDWLEDKSYELTQIVADHGSRLATGKTAQPYGVTNHAVLFGLLAKHTLESHLPGAAEALSLATIRYGRERGERMRQRCQRYGDPVNMLSYKAYCEWRPEEEHFDDAVLQASPVQKTEVYSCPWSRVWAEEGYMPYAKYYCDYADYNLVKGFSDTLKLEMGGSLARGDHACSFTWCGADLSEENAAWLSQRRGALAPHVTFGWEYHSAHLYFSMLATLKNALGSGVAEVERRVRASYAQRFTEESLSVIDGYAGLDFKAALYDEAAYAY